MTFPALNLEFPSLLHLLLMLSVCLLVSIGGRINRCQDAVLRTIQWFAGHRRFRKMLSKYDLLLILLIRPVLCLYYFLTEGFFLYQWDDQAGYFDVAQGLVNLNPIYERFTFGLPALIAPFIKFFHPQHYTDLVLPFSLFNAFVLGTLGMYWVFKITELLTSQQQAARMAAVIYAIHPFLPFFARTERNWHLRAQIHVGDMLGWNMTSDHVGTVFLLLAVVLFLQALQDRRSLFPAGLMVGFAGLIRIPNMIIWIPLCYLALMKKRPLRSYLPFFAGMVVILTPQLVYNKYYFGSPFRFGYTAIGGHIGHYWEFQLLYHGKQLLTVLRDHYLLILFFLLAIIFRPDHRRGVFLLLWVALFISYYAGYEQFYANPIRFLIPLRPGLCIGIGTLWMLDQQWRRRWFVLGSLSLLVIFTSYSEHLIPFPTVPSALLVICAGMTIIGVYLHLPFSAMLPMYFYAFFYRFLATGTFVEMAILFSVCLGINALQGQWVRIAAIPSICSFHRLLQQCSSPSNWPEILSNCYRSHRVACMVVFGILATGTAGVLAVGERSGLHGIYYRNSQWEGEPALTLRNQQPGVKGKEGENILAAQGFSATWSGWINITVPGTYTFATHSDDGSELRIAGQTVVDNGGVHGLRRVSGEITLPKGIYPIEIRYFQVGGYNILETFWTPPGQPEQPLPDAVLYSRQPHWLTILWRNSRPPLIQGIKILWGGLTLFVCLAGIMAGLAHPTGRRSVECARRWNASTGSAILRLQRYRTATLSLLGFLVLCSMAIWWLYTFNSWGLTGIYYQNPDWEGQPALTQLDKQPHVKGGVGENLLKAVEFSVIWQGWINLKQTGTYLFETCSDDGSLLRIAEQTVIDDRERRGLQCVSDDIELSHGIYSIEVHYFQSGGFSFLRVFWTPPGQPKRLIPPEALFATVPKSGEILARTMIVGCSQLLKILWAILFGIASLIFLSTPVKT